MPQPVVGGDGRIKVRKASIQDRCRAAGGRPGCKVPRSCVHPGGQRSDRTTLYEPITLAMEFGVGRDRAVHITSSRTARSPLHGILSVAPRSRLYGGQFSARPRGARTVSEPTAFLRVGSWTKRAPAVRISPHAPEGVVEAPLRTGWRQDAEMTASPAHEVPARAPKWRRMSPSSACRRARGVACWPLQLR